MAGCRGVCSAYLRYAVKRAIFRLVRLKREQVDGDDVLYEQIINQPLFTKPQLADPDFVFGMQRYGRAMRYVLRQQSSYLFGAV